MQLAFPDFLTIVMVLGGLALAVGLVVFIRDFGRMQSGLRASLFSAHAASTPSRPHTLRVQAFMPEGLLWHLTRLPGLQVVSTRTISGEPTRFESYFLYKERLFIMEEPFAVTISLLGQPPDRALFAEIEAHVQRYNRLTSLPGIISGAFRFLWLPRHPSRRVLDRYYPDHAAAPAAKRDWVHLSRQSNDGGIDPLAEAEVYVAGGHKEMAIQLLEQALAGDPTPDRIRERLSELKCGS